MNTIKTKSAQKEKDATQHLDQEIRIMKDKVAKMRVLNDLECELLILTKVHAKFRALRAETEREIKTRHTEDDFKLSDDNSGNTDYINDSDDSMDSHSDIK